MTKNDDWGISLCPDSPSRANWSATRDLFFAMVEYFDAPEREDYLVSRIQVEEFIRDMVSEEDPLGEQDDELTDLQEFFVKTEADQFWLYAWW